ncbi:MAG: hypothetical protein A3D67_03310 [Candidatus Lloydbacteria bacterium RIFCSPHIGHO2_02_FULL_51_22]|uniref:HEPN domain-containing protein n=3 Tax=Candidatus Lloydiibacteriota TaxID=1817910 RepID=A0A1G2DDG3_9BACT|nr:MAG: hypothetical protein A3D67_03310 [Candidatus Lloydbacteria bacterium RIFCSPHIGHO2_02_FULL_51_22]OGZ15182.1 MAG: hypothetical protein A3J08_02920 [Candidatus Lloydbacteria bacterium RIFCSPLOWO2_02_FULL_51_11]OGZ16266.1 MAG: hypothetical protein A3G11_01040 [Candidatus Lloydbacteria bacterium RIFCSPLOWO2_12_FULL_51_9]
MKNKFYDFEPVDFLGNGKHCISVAKQLKDGCGETGKAEANYPMRVLLIHGIELLLKSLILHFDSSKFSKEHDIKKLYDTAKDIVIQKELGIQDFLSEDEIKKIVDDYYPDSMKARYYNKTSRFDFSIFYSLENFVKILEEYIKPNT